MAYEREGFIPVQGSIYTSENHSERQLRIVYSIPENGMNEKSGILCLIPGYGGNIDSSVYHKMRCQFADDYNLAVLQCDYFGIKYMHDYERGGESEKQCRNGQKEIEIETGENWDDCNDMGPMQAADIIAMLLWFIKSAVQEGTLFNADKIIAYGHSHGAYLAYLTNRLCPGLLRVIIDNSSYIFPDYLHCSRMVRYADENGKRYSVSGNIKYLVMREPHMRLQEEFYHLLYLYSNFKNECRIISLHGTKDAMAAIGEKKIFIDKIGEKAALAAIQPYNVDGVIFKNAEHGLGADFIKLYQAVAQRIPFTEGKNLVIPDSVVIEGNRESLKISYDGLIPHLEWNKKY